MDLKKLRYFLALTEELHFERAALRVGADQPTFSRKIRELERDLGVTLFARNNQGTRGITPAGHALLPLAQVIVTKFDQAVQAVSEASASGIYDQLRIGICDDVPMRALAYVLSKFRAKEPRLDIQLIDRPCHTLIQDVHMGVVDVGMSLGRPNSAMLNAIPLWSDPAEVVLPRTHALVACTSVALADLTNERLVMGHRACGCGRRDEVDGLLRSSMERLHVKDAVNLGVLQTLVASGHGIGIVSAAHAERIRETDLVLRPLNDQELAYRTFLVRRTGDESRRTMRFIELAKQSVQRGA